MQDWQLRTTQSEKRRDCQLAEAQQLAGEDDSSPPHTKFSSVCILVSLSHPLIHLILPLVLLHACLSLLPHFLPHAISSSYREGILCIYVHCFCLPSWAAGPRLALLSFIWYRARGGMQETQKTYFAKVNTSASGRKKWERIVRRQNGSKRERRCD